MTVAVQGPFPTPGLVQTRLRQEGEGPLCPDPSKAPSVQGCLRCVCLEQAARWRRWSRVSQTLVRLAGVPAPGQDRVSAGSGGFRPEQSGRSDGPRFRSGTKW